MKRRVIALAAVVMLFATGCDVLNGGDINDNPDAGSRQEQLDMLRKRPDIEQVTRTYQQLVADIRKVTVERFGLPEWEFGKDDEITKSGCGFDLPDVRLRDGGESRGVNGGFSRANLPDEKWQEALDVVSQLAQEQGFTEGPGVLIDRPGEHVVELYDTKYGARLEFGTMLRTTLGISTGCHLTPEAHGGGGAEVSPPQWLPIPTSSVPESGGDAG